MVLARNCFSLAHHITAGQNLNSSTSANDRKTSWSQHIDLTADMHVSIVIEYDENRPLGGKRVSFRGLLFSRPLKIESQKLATTVPGISPIWRQQPRLAFPGIRACVRACITSVWEKKIKNYTLYTRWCVRACCGRGVYMQHSARRNRKTAVV